MAGRVVNIDVRHQLQITQEAKADNSHDAPLDVDFGFEFYILTDEGIPDYWEMFTWLVESTHSSPSQSL